MEGQKNCTKIKRDGTLKRQPRWKYRIVNFHMDIRSANLASPRLKDNSAGNLILNAELRFRITYKMVLILTILHLNLNYNYRSFSVMAT